MIKVKLVRIYIKIIRKYKQMLLWLSSDGHFKHDIKNINHIRTSKNNTKPVSNKGKTLVSLTTSNFWLLNGEKQHKVKRQNYNRQKYLQYKWWVNHLNK